MKPETDPIDDDEWLLRRVRVERFRTDDVPMISPNAFEPRVRGRDRDDDGISLFREACLSEPVQVLSTIEVGKRSQYGIVKVQVRNLREMSLSVQSKPDLGIPGHVVIRELNADEYQQDRARMTPIKLRLAELASQNIVVWPVEGSH
jgi:hypothetical protein